MLSTFPHSLQCEVDYLNKIITNNPYYHSDKWVSYISRRLDVLQNKVNNLHNFAAKKDGRVKDYMLSQLDLIQSQIDSIVFSISH